MIDNIEDLYTEFEKMAECDFLKNSTEKNEAYAAFFFGLTISMTNTYEISPEIWAEQVGQIFMTKFKFTQEHAVEYLSFLMQSIQPRVNPKFYAVIRMGIDSFYDLEDGDFDEIKTVLPVAVSSIVGGVESDIKFY